MTSQGRRKHGACLFRMKENCPFRKLRRNKCCDSMNSVVLGGGQWGTAQTSVSNGVINAAVSVETFPTPPKMQSPSHPQEELSAMDTDTGPSTSASRPNYMVSTAGRPNFSLINQQQHNSDTSMDLESGVDPETGERAQG